LPEIAQHVQLAFQRAGYSVRLVEAASLRYARLVLRLPGSGDEREADLLKEALEPRWVTAQITAAASVRANSLEDTVGLKARSACQDDLARADGQRRAAHRGLGLGEGRHFTPRGSTPGTEVVPGDC